MEATIKEKINVILSRHNGKKDELIPLLQETQEEFGYLPTAAMQEIARFLKISEGTVFGVASFYAQFRFAPAGRNTVRVCRGTACHVRGAPRILQKVEHQLGIKPGESTPDLEYSLETIACFGSCALSPVMVVNRNVYGRMTPAKVSEILGKNK